MNREKFTAWRKSTHSDDDSNCVEVAPGTHGSIGVRDSKSPAGPHLAFTEADWAGFLAAAKTGRFDSSQR